MKMCFFNSKITPLKLLLKSNIIKLNSSKVFIGPSPHKKTNSLNWQYISNRFNLTAFRWILYFFLAGFLSVSSSKASAHSHAHSQSHNHKNIPPELIEHIYEKAIMLSPEVIEIAQDSLAEPHIRIGRHNIVLNSSFWELVKGWLRLYRKEIEVYCPCDISEEALVKDIKNHISSGFIYSKIGQPIAHLSEHIIVGSYGLSAKYGKTAILLKASAEVAETALSIFVGGKGIHILCNVIDTMILFLFRKTQIYARTFRNSRTMNKSGLLMMFRLAWLNRLMKKAQNKVFFHLESVEINQTALANVNQEGIGKNNRMKWVTAISQKATSVLEEITEIDRQLEMGQLSKRQQKKRLRKRRKLYQQMEQITAVSRKSFLGKRYKRFLLLRSRKSNMGYLKGAGFPDTITSENWFWMLFIQENILERSLVQEASREMQTPHREYHAVLKKDEIREGLAREFVERVNKTGLDMTKPLHSLSAGANNTAQGSENQSHLTTTEQQNIRSVEKILMDIENIFNPSLTVKERYLLVSILESGLTGFFEYYLRLMYNRLSTTTENMNIWTKARLKWRLERFTYYIFSYADFLRTIAFIKKKSTLMAYQYEAMENFLLFFEYLHKLSQISVSYKTKTELLAIMDKNLQYIQSAQVQKEKRTTFSWIPFRTPLPYCRNLIRSL